MNLSPERAIGQLLTAFEESKKRVKSLEESLALERQGAQDALSEAKADWVAVSVKMGVDIASLRQKIADLEEEAVKRSAEMDGTIHSLRQENSFLTDKLLEAADAAAVKAEVEEADGDLREKYEKLESAYRELKHAFSELQTGQAELAANANAYEQLALEAAQEKADVERALQDLQSKYASKSKTAVKPVQAIASLKTDIERLKAELASATRLHDTHGEAYAKLEGKYKDQKSLVLELQHQYDKLSDTNKKVTKELITLKKAPAPTSESWKEYEELKTERDRLKATCSDLEVQNLQLHQDCRNVRTSKNLLEQTCDEIIEAGENLECEAAHLRDTIASLQNESRLMDDRLKHVETVNRACRSRIQNGRVPTSVARVLYEDFMNKFPPSVGERPDSSSLQRIAKAGINLHDYLASDPICKGYLEHVLFLPKRTVWSSTARLHALAFYPTHYYHGWDTWAEVTDLSAMAGSWSELFLDVDDSIIYAGTYRLYDLRYLCPGGTAPPEGVSSLEMESAAHLGALPPNQRAQVIAAKFSSGVIDTDCMGLQCIGFNATLYDALRRRIHGTKREGDEIEGPEVKRAR
ncbi:hypothetical protein B0H19DRAFT_1156174 [Mycena capillaripes]|nr:hypothetical protein B0H19DRAFT_1156174 [Mycena capillaripes]